MRLKHTSLLLCLILIFSLVHLAAADDFPTRPVTIVVSFGVGGMADTSSRILAPVMAEYLGEEVIVENRPGAGGMIAVRHVLTRNPDGYTINLHTWPVFVQSVLTEQPFDLEEIAFIGGYMPQQRVLFSHKDKPWDDFEGFMEYAAENPGVVTVGGGADPWALNVLRAMGKEDGLSMNYILFESGGACSAALLGGHVDVAETGVGTPAWQAAKEGELNILAVLTDGDLSQFGYPEVENLADKGYTFVSQIYYGLLAPGDIPEARRQKLQDALQYAIEHPDVIRRLENIDLEHQFMPGEDAKVGIQKIMNDVVELGDFLGQE